MLAQGEILALKGVEGQEAELAGVNNKPSEDIESLEPEAESKKWQVARVQEDPAMVNKDIEKFFQNSKSNLELAEKQH